MRFSDMMGNGSERSAKQPAASGTDPVIANALAPYLDSTEPAEADESTEAGEAAAVPERTEPLAGAARAEVAAIPPIAPAPAVHTAAVFAQATAAPRAESAPAPTPADPMVGIADFTPLSDDLLPRRR